MAKPINTEKQDEFLVALVATRGNIKAACERVGLDRSSFYDWKKKPEFADKLTFYIQRSEDSIVDEITAPLYNAYIWEAQIQQKIRNGEKAKPTMKVETFFNLGFKLLSLTKKGKEMLGMVQPIETAQTDVSGGTERLIAQLKGILPNPNIPAPRRNLEDLDHFGNPIKKEGENE